MAQQGNGRPGQRGAHRTRPEQVRDLIMIVILAVWMAFAVAAFAQLLTRGINAIDNLLPFWFWGLPVAPFTAMYAPWRLPGTAAPE